MTQQAQRYEFLDGLRFLCAFWVAVGHLGLPPIWTLFTGPTAETIQAILTPFSYLFNGTAAVIVFFLISGFCIHLPYVTGRPFDLVAFYAARLPRVLVPTIAAIGFGFLIPDGFPYLKAVLWSLYCEIGYYLLYPVIRIGFGFVSRFALIAPFYGLAVICVMAFGNPEGATGGQIWALGLIGSTVFGLPIWMTGCWIAELVSAQARPAFATRPAWIWSLRTLVLALGALTLLLHFHSGIKYTHSLLFFSLVSAVWLYSEFLQREGQGFYERFAKLGQATFSIYLVHKLSIPLTLLLLTDPRPMGKWLVQMVLASGLSLAFYFLVEKPSHAMAKKLASRRLQFKQRTLAVSS